MANCNQINCDGPDSSNPEKGVENSVSSVQQGLRRSTRKRKRTDKYSPPQLSECENVTSERSERVLFSLESPMTNRSSSTRKRMNTDKFSSTEEIAIKKRKQNSKESNSIIQKNGSSVKTVMSTADLPPEMLAAIFQNVSTKDLLKCRQMNRTWNEISSRIMCQRADLELRFCFKNGQFIRQVEDKDCCIRKGACTEYWKLDACRHYHSSSSLTDLVDCLKVSGNNFPYTYFHFDGLANFANQDMRNFLSIWGKNVLSLRVDFDDSVNAAGILRDLLLEKIPNLKKLEIEFAYHWDFSETSPSIQLFADSHEFQLPKLEVFCVNYWSSGFGGIIENILQAACNLNIFDGSTMHYDALKTFQSLNKWHCLKSVSIYLSESEDLIVALEKLAKSVKLQHLVLSFEEPISDNGLLKSKASAIINQLLYSSKDVIQSLTIEPLGWLPGLVIPKLQILSKLNLLQNFELGPIAMFPPQLEMADVFPNLKDLEVRIPCNDAFFPPSQPLKPMQSIEILKIFVDTSADGTEKLMKATPNVKTLLMSDTGYNDFRVAFGDGNVDYLDAFRTVSKHLTKLENFEWIITQSTHHELLDKLDAIVTGLPQHFCNKMSAKLRNKEHLSADEQKQVQLQQRNSSILDLKELQKLDIDFFIDMKHYWCRHSESDESDYECECEVIEERKDVAGFDRDSVFYKTGFTKVSQFLAFDLMPNLTVRTHVH